MPGRAIETPELGEHWSKMICSTWGITLLSVYKVYKIVCQYFWRGTENYWNSGLKSPFSWFQTLIVTQMRIMRDQQTDRLSPLFIIVLVLSSAAIGSYRQPRTNEVLIVRLVTDRTVWYTLAAQLEDFDLAWVLPFHRVPFPERPTKTIYGQNNLLKTLNRKLTRCASCFCSPVILSMQERCLHFPPEMTWWC